jgi:hypothetical protein
VLKPLRFSTEITGKVKSITLIFLFANLYLVATVQFETESQSTIHLFNFAPRRFRTVTEFQEPGKCFELFPGEFLDDAARRRIFWSGVDEKAMLPSFAHELAALTLKMPN